MNRKPPLNIDIKLNRLFFGGQGMSIHIVVSLKWLISLKNQKSSSLFHTLPGPLRITNVMKEST